MTRLLLLPITLPLRIVRATAELSFGVARGVLEAVRVPDERAPDDDELFAAPDAAGPEPEPGPYVETDDELVAEAGPEPGPYVETDDELVAEAGPEPGPYVETDDELVAEAGPERDPGPEIHVDEPWPGYDAMALDEVLARLEGADEAQVAIVRLYERQNENRQAVLLATGEEP
jgi:hypothetical protein